MKWRNRAAGSLRPPRRRKTTRFPSGSSRAGITTASASKSEKQTFMNRLPIGLRMTLMRSQRLPRWAGEACTGSGAHQMSWARTRCQPGNVIEFPVEIVSAEIKVDPLTTRRSFWSGDCVPFVFDQDLHRDANNANGRRPKPPGVTLYALRSWARTL